MNKNKIKNTTLTIFFVAVISICGFYYYIGIGFGNAASKTIEGVHNANKKWKEKGINPLDTIIRNVKEVIDTTKIDSTQKLNIKLKN